MLRPPCLPAIGRCRYASSTPMRNTAEKRSPGAAIGRLRPVVNALVGAVIGSSAISCWPAGAKTCANG